MNFDGEQELTSANVRSLGASEAGEVGGHGDGEVDTNLASLDLHLVPASKENKQKGGTGADESRMKS